MTSREVLLLGSAPHSGKWRVQPNRWTTLAASMIAELCGGTMYLFGLYSGDISATLGFSQTQTDSIALLSNIGNFCNIFSGIAMDALGAKAVILLGCFLNCVGYVLMWLGATQRISVGLTPMLLFALIWGNGSGWFDTAVMTTNLQNFPRQRGLVSGLLKSFFGLSASVLTLLYDSLFKPDTGAFILFLGMGISGLGLLLVPFFDKSDAGLADADTRGLSVRGRILCGYAVVVLCCAYLAAISITDAIRPDLLPTEGDAKDWLAGGLALVLCLFLLLPVGTERPLQCGAGVRRESAAEALSSASEARPTTRAELHVLEALLEADWWLVFFVSWLGMGSGLVVVNNVAALAESLGADEGQELTLVSLLSIGNAVGRMLFGGLSDACLQCVPRTGWLVVASAIMLGCMLFLLFGNLQTLYFGCTMVGLAYGAFWGLVPTLTIDLFGATHFGKNYTVMCFAPAAASLTMATALAGTVYDHFAEQQASEVCVGPECFAITLIVCAGLCGVALLLSIVLVVRTVPFYRELAETLYSSKAK